MFTRRKVYYPYISPFDPCPPIPWKTYATPPHLYVQVQPRQLPQFAPLEALHKGTLWPSYYDPYDGPHEAPPQGGGV